MRNEIYSFLCAMSTKGYKIFRSNKELLLRDEFTRKFTQSSQLDVVCNVFVLLLFLILFLAEDEEAEAAE